MIRKDLTKNHDHIDYIWRYEELDRTYSQLRLSQYDTKKKQNIAKKYHTDENGKTRSSWMQVCTDIPCAFDIETCTIAGTVNLYNGKSGNYSAAYCMQFAIGNHVVIFRHWQDVQAFVQKLPKLLKLSKNTVLMTWVHNLDFETSYIKHRFDIDETTFFGKSKTKPIKYLLGNHFYMHDSYSITNCSLAKLADMYSTLHKKAAGDMNHQELHNSFSKLSDKEIGYVANDVLVLTDFGRIMFDEFLLKKGYIPDTSTQILSRELQDNAIKYGREFLGKRYDKIIEQYDDDMQGRMILKSIHGKIFGYDWNDNGTEHHAEGMVNPDHFTPYDENGVQIPVQGKEIYGITYYDFYKWLFRGGYTKSNARYTSTIDIDPEGLQVIMYGFDFTSSYPFTQSVCNFPMSKFIPVQLDDKQLFSLHFQYDHDDFEKWRYIAIIKFENLQSINDFSLESKSKVAIEGHYIIDNGRIHRADIVTACLTDCDIALYKLYYKWDNATVLKCWKASAGKLPDYLLYTLWENGLKKQSLKGIEDMYVDYMLAKIKFNSAFGLSCKKPVYTEYKIGNTMISDTEYISRETFNFKFFGKSDVFTHTVENSVENVELDKDECKMQRYEDCVKKSILSPFWGIWTSAFARYNLLLNIWKISQESPVLDDEQNTNDTVYCDTDSLYFRDEKHIMIIDVWNIWAAKRVKEHIPEEYSSLWKLGQFTNIAAEDSNGATDHFCNFKTLGAKRYIKSYLKRYRPKHKHIKSIAMHDSVTVAGLPKGVLEKYCYDNQLDIYREFRDKMDFCIDGHELLMKLGRTYHDEITIINIDGEIMTEYSSCTLYPTGFKLRVDDIYNQFISSVMHDDNKSLGEYLMRGDDQ